MCSYVDPFTLLISKSQKCQVTFSNEVTLRSLLPNTNIDIRWSGTCTTSRCQAKLRSDSENFALSPSLSLSLCQCLCLAAPLPHCVVCWSLIKPRNSWIRWISPVLYCSLRGTLAYCTRRMESQQNSGTSYWSFPVGGDVFLGLRWTLSLSPSLFRSFDLPSSRY